MGKSRFAESQIIKVLKKVEGGRRRVPRSLHFRISETPLPEITLAGFGQGKGRFESGRYSYKYLI